MSHMLPRLAPQAGNHDEPLLLLPEILHITACDQLRGKRADSARRRRRPVITAVPAGVYPRRAAPQACRQPYPGPVPRDQAARTLRREGTSRN